MNDRRRGRKARLAVAICLALCAAATLAGGGAAATSDAEITVSAGSLSVTTPDFQPAELLVEAADRALYAAKAGGRDRVIAGPATVGAA